jgi:hypothetical protein
MIPDRHLGVSQDEVNRLILMAKRAINPGKVTKPIQLLAAWLAGLIVVNGSFLGAATQLSKPEWASGLLVVASVLNVACTRFG